MFNTIPNNPFPPSSASAGGGGSSYVLPVASADTLGGVKVGDGLEITDGVLSANEYTLPNASAEKLGGVKVGDDLTIDAGGVLGVELSIPVYDEYKISTDASGFIVVSKYHGGEFVSSTTFEGGSFYTRDVDGKFTVSCTVSTPYWVIELTEAGTDAPAGTTYGWGYGETPAVSEIKYTATPDTGTASEFITDILEKLPPVPSSNGAYVLTATRTSGGVSYTWESTT